MKLWKKEEAREVLNEIAGYCDIILPGIDEGELLALEKHWKIRRLLFGKRRKMIIIKLGAAEAYYATKDENAYVQVYKVNRKRAYALSVPGDVERYPYWALIDLNNNQSEVLW